MPLVHCYLVVFLPYQHQTHQPYGEECVGENLVDVRHSYKPRHNPEYEVYIEKDIPQPLTIMEHTFDIASCGDLDFLCRGQRNVNALAVLSYRDASTELNTKGIAAMRGVYPELVIL